jgi:outer membrane protein assembly factor BamD
MSAPARRRGPNRFVRLGIAAALAVSVAGCESIPTFGLFNSEKPYKPEIIPDVPAPQLYNDGLVLLNKGSYASAAKKFEELDRQYPYSQWSQRALIMTTFTQYENKDYGEAVGSAKRYLQLYPASKDAAYAQYLLAMSYYNQIPDITRDQDLSEKALQAFRELIERYPSSEYVQEARFKLEVARDQLAGKEMMVGRFYLKKRNYTGAVNRFRAVVSSYQTTRHVEEALMRLTEAYFAMGVASEAQTAAAVLGHNFPDSPWYKDAFTLLDSNGLAPREDRGSWISRAFQGFRRSTGLG